MNLLEKYHLLWWGVLKRLWIEAICKERGINPAKTIMVGDGANDRDAMEASALAVGFQAKEVLFPLVHVYNGTNSHEPF